MRDQVWAALCALAENEGITFSDCLGLTLQVLNLLPQIPVDISFQTQIPLTIACCSESSVYRRWCPEQDSISPLCKEVRASRTLSKVLGGVTHQPSEGMDCRAPEINHAAMPEVLPQPVAGDQALWALWPVVTLSAPTPLKAARDHQAANPNSPMMRKAPLMEMRMPRQTRVKLRLQATARWHLMAKRGKNTLKLRTPSLALAKSLVRMRTLTQSPTPRRRSSPSGRSGGNQAPRRTALPRNPASHLLRKNCPQMRHSTMRPSKKLISWTHVLMLGAAKRLPKTLWAGLPETP